MLLSNIYKYFLDGIKKETTSTVPPERYLRVINEALTNWVRDRANEADDSQKRMDDLNKLVIERIITTTQDPLHPTTPIIAENEFTLPVDYLRLLSVSVRLRYKDNYCYPDGMLSDWLPCKYYIFDKKGMSYRNPYRKPSDSRVYYQLKENKINFIQGTSDVEEVDFIYIRYPKEIEVIVNPTDFYDDIQDVQIHEVIDIAVRMYIERIKDPRYQSFLMEERIKSQNK